MQQTIFSLNAQQNILASSLKVLPLMTLTYSERLQPTTSQVRLQDITGRDIGT